MNAKKREPEPHHYHHPYGLGWFLEFMKHQGFAVAFGCFVLWKGSIVVDTHLAFVRLQSEQAILQTRSLQAIELSNGRQEGKLEEIRGTVQESENNRKSEHETILKSIRDK